MVSTLEEQLHTPKIALGAWAWGKGAAGGDQVFGNDYTANELKPVFDKALSEGFTLWDTAAVYGMGSSETILGNFVKEVPREEVLLSTKFTPQIALDSPSPVEEMMDGSMKRLGATSIDIYWIHNPADVKKWTPELIPLAKSGKIKYIGVSNHNLDELKLANEILAKEGLKISAIQNHYSLLHRSSKKAGILDYAKENDIAFFSYMVLEQGALTGTYSSDNPFLEGTERAEAYNHKFNLIDKLNQSLKTVADKYQTENSQVAIAWAIAKGTLPIIGVTKVSQVEAAAQALNIQLSPNDIIYLEKSASEINVNTLRGWEKSIS